MIASSLTSCAIRSSRAAFSNWLIDSRRCLHILSSSDSSCVSSSSIRSSTSCCLMAAVISRSVARRGLSLARMASLTSSVMRSLSDIRSVQRGVSTCGRGGKVREKLFSASVLLLLPFCVCVPAWAFHKTRDGVPQRGCRLFHRRA